ncbi:MAG: site-specific integrase [Actinobacteria bacterium]|nr:site-specific integrase [Actinomycetota bacterium]
MSELSKTSVPGIYRAHKKACDRKGRCDCPYVIVWRHRGRQHKERCKTFNEAREKKSIRDSVDSKPVERARFGEYFASWIETYAGRTQRGFSETTRPEYRRTIANHALPRWKTWKLGDIETRDIRELLTAMRNEGLSTSMIRKTRASLSTLFATALEDGLIASNPIRGVRIPPPLVDNRPEKERPKALTKAELATLLSAIPENRHLFFEFLVHTGLRISEMIGLTWAHLELEGSPKVKVREQFYRGERRKLKSGAGRRDIPLAPRMTERLIAHKEANYSGPDEPVFTSDVGTELIRGKVAEKVLNPARDLVGMPWVSFHAFRHTCASLLFANGKNIKQIQTWLGHADPAFTLRTYIHLLDDGVGSADFLDDAIEIGRGPWTRDPED